MKTETPDPIRECEAEIKDLTLRAQQAERERDEAIAARKASAADWLNQVEQANARVSRALQQEARAAAMSRRYICHECGRKGRHSKQNRGAQPICPPCDFSRLFGSGRPEDWQGFDEAVERWRNEGEIQKPQYHAATRPSGLRAIAVGLTKCPSIDAAIDCLRVAADRLEELERDRDEARKIADAAMWEADRLRPRINLMPHEE